MPGRLSLLPGRAGELVAAVVLARSLAAYIHANTSCLPVRLLHTRGRLAGYYQVRMHFAIGRSRFPRKLASCSGFQRVLLPFLHTFDISCIVVVFPFPFAWRGMLSQSDYFESVPTYPR